MPDQLTDEQLEHLFADLRADELPRAVPPGTAAARTTVRRRRTVTAVAAGVTALAIAGGIATGLGTFGTRQNAIETAAVPTPSTEISVGPKPSRKELNRYSRLAKATVNRLAGDKDRADVTTVGNRATIVEDVKRGSYELLMSCVGTGTITVNLSVGTLLKDKADTANLDRWKNFLTELDETVACETTSWDNDENAVNELAVGLKSLPFTAEHDGSIVIRVDADAAATNRAAFAWYAKPTP